MRTHRARWAALLLIWLLASCRADAPASPTPWIDNLRTEGPPITYEEIENGLIGHWVMTTPWEQAGDFYPVRELVFQPNRVWVTPTFKDYGGRYYLDDVDKIRLRHDPTDTTRFWIFHVVDDTLTLTDASGVTVAYARDVTRRAPPTSAP